MFHMQHFGKRKFGGSINSTSEFMASPKNQRLRPCVAHTEDGIPVRKLYFCVPSADVSCYISNELNFLLLFLFRFG